MSTRTQNYTMSAASGEGDIGGVDDSVVVFGRDGGQANVDATVLYPREEGGRDRGVRERRHGLHQQRSCDHPHVRASAPSSPRATSSTASTASWPEISDTITDCMREKIEPRGITLEDFQLRDVRLSPQVQQAVEASDRCARPPGCSSVPGVPALRVHPGAARQFAAPGEQHDDRPRRTTARHRWCRCRQRPTPTARRPDAPTASADDAGQRAAVEAAGRHRVAVVVTFTLAAGTLLTWTDYAFSDSAEFSRRAVAILDSSSVRDEIAEEIAEALVQATPEAVAFRSVLIAVAEDVIDTDAFRTLFHAAVDEAHKALFSSGGQQVLVNLSESVAVISTTLQIINPNVATNLSPDTANVIARHLGQDPVAPLARSIGHDLAEIGSTRC